MITALLAHATADPLRTLCRVPSLWVDALCPLTCAPTSAVTRFLGCKVVLLGCYNGQGLHTEGAGAEEGAGPRETDPRDGGVVLYSREGEAEDGSGPTFVRVLLQRGRMQVRGWHGVWGWVSACRCECLLAGVRGGVATDKGRAADGPAGMHGWKVTRLSSVVPMAWDLPPPNAFPARLATRDRANNRATPGGQPSSPLRAPSMRVAILTLLCYSTSRLARIFILPVAHR